MQLFITIKRIVGSLMKSATTNHVYIISNENSMLGIFTLQQVFPTYSPQGNFVWPAKEPKWNRSQGKLLNLWKNLKNKITKARHFYEALDKYNITPDFFQKRLRYSIRRVGIVYDCILIFILTSNSTFGKIWIFVTFSVFMVNINKHTTQWPMGHSGADVVHKRPQKLEMHWQNQLKILVLAYGIIFYRTNYKTTNAVFV